MLNHRRHSLRGGAAVAALAMVSAALSQFSVPASAIPERHRGVSNPPSTVRTVSAEFGPVDDDDTYEYILSGTIFGPHKRSVTLRGELQSSSEDVYFVAVAIGRRAGLKIASDLRTARVATVLKITSCADDDGNPVPDSSVCARGRHIKVHASWHHAGHMTQFPSTQKDPARARGRLAATKACLSIESGCLSANYGEILETYNP